MSQPPATVCYVTQEIADTAPIHQTTPAQQDACGKVQHAVMMCHNYDGFPESCNEQPQCKSCPWETLKVVVAAAVHLQVWLQTVAMKCA